MPEGDEPSLSLAETALAMGIDPEEIARRRAYLRLSDDDGELLRDLRSHVGDVGARFVDLFYDHLFAFDRTRALLEDPETVGRLKRTQAAYFKRLLSGDYGWQYALDRLRVGLAHQHVGLEPEWYLGAYFLYLTELLPWVLGAAGERAIETFRALLKVVFLDMELAIRTYVHAERAAVQRSETRFRGLIERLPDAVLVHRDGRLVYVNGAAVRFLGYEKAEDLVGRPVLDMVHPDDRAAVIECIRVARSGQQTPPREIRMIRADGHVVVGESVGLAISFEGQPAVLGVVRDVSERQRLATRAMEMDRLISIGTLAAGVGHEINNPLSFVMANIEFALEDLREIDSELGGDLAQRLYQTREALGEALEGARRIREVVADLKDLARAPGDTRGPVRVEQVVDSAIHMAWNEIRHRARLVRDLAPVPPVLASEGRLLQVFINLLVNAAQAIPEGSNPPGEIRVSSSQRDGLVCVEVRDNGSGIAPENLGRIFEAFYTTKPAGQGTGLGLAISLEIVRGFGGEIEVESEPGKGTTFRVLLPLAPSEARPLAPPRDERDAPVGRRRILVVDDERAVARAVARFLQRDHDVEVACSAGEALDRLRDGARFDLLLCDLMMPGMSGAGLFEQLTARFPDQADRILFMTGGAFTPEARALLERMGNRCVEKPVEPVSLRQKVREILEGP